MLCLLFTNTPRDHSVFSIVRWFITCLYLTRSPIFMFHSMALPKGDKVLFGCLSSYILSQYCSDHLTINLSCSHHTGPNHLPAYHFHLFITFMFTPIVRNNLKCPLCKIFITSPLSAYPMNIPYCIVGFLIGKSNMFKFLSVTS